ncbi:MULTISPECIES: type II toxin-antitoxin system RelE/ParE family toxin [unclassified Brevibacterium]|uniref:type II toxin-antitoxin system RelE/ParE family toxin n=1 Tax=unclassified Brevibacterium TaxID=2614124 RepID=UPI0010FA04AC|nr:MULTISPECIES: type II toxin-antitoxin system RelE/ParE family toxin [unclassified Brevibacterium]MCM1012467.1 type II toxin-antitoxin system RelE/ParE family toxin [Brevibacterium sp. XM4083]
MWRVVDHPDAAVEYRRLDAREAVAVDNAIAKLALLGPSLPYPHSSAVRSAEKLRELRPRGGRSITRALYRQFGEVFVVGAYGPEAQHDRKGFAKACRDAELRLNQIEE